MARISDLQVVQATTCYKQQGYSRIWDCLEAQTGHPHKVCLRAMERADARGLTDYGVNIGLGWPTEKGLKLLEISRAIKCANGDRDCIEGFIL